MAKLLSSAIMSLDGYVTDESGNFDLAVPDGEMHASSTSSSGPSAPTWTAAACTRDGRLEDRPALAAQSRVMRDFADIWQAADKVV